MTDETAMSPETEATSSSVGDDLCLGNKIYTWGIIRSKTDPNGKSEISIPAVVPTKTTNPYIAKNFVSVQCQNFSFAALTSDGKILSWGRNVTSMRSSFF